MNACYHKPTGTTQLIKSIHHPTLPLKLGPKLIVPPTAFHGDHNNGEQLHNWAKQKIPKSYKKKTPVQKQRPHELLKQSKITFSVEIVVEQEKLIFHPQTAAPRVKTNPSPFICHEIHYKFDRYTKTPQDILSSIIHTMDFPTHVPYKFNSHIT